jgi:hypothetical protein
MPGNENAAVGDLFDIQLNFPVLPILSFAHSTSVPQLQVVFIRDPISLSFQFAR